MLQASGSSSKLPPVGRLRLPVTSSLGTVKSTQSISEIAPAPFFPWNLLMSHLTSLKQLIQICRNGTPIAMGYLDQSETYAPIRRVAEYLGYTVKWDDLDFLVDS
jgi:hypothetical protein